MPISIVVPWLNSLTLADFGITVAANVLLLGLLQFLVAAWLKARLEESIKHEYSRALEDYRFTLKRREYAAGVADLLSTWLASGESQDKIRLNKIAWELSLWLPSDLVREMTNCLSQEEGAPDPVELLIAVRKLLQDRGDNLKSDEILHFK
jgi:hypothetical protein